jgi:hypothetical protein
MKKISYDAFYCFPGNPIEPRYERYRKLSVGKAHPQGIYLGVGATEHTPSTHVSIYLLSLSTRLNYPSFLYLPNLLYL